MRAGPLGERSQRALGSHWRILQEKRSKLRCGGVAGECRGQFHHHHRLEDLWTLQCLEGLGVNYMSDYRLPYAMPDYCGLLLREALLERRENAAIHFHIARQMLIGRFGLALVSLPVQR